MTSENLRRVRNRYGVSHMQARRMFRDVTVEDNDDPHLFDFDEDPDLFGDPEANDRSD